MKRSKMEGIRYYIEEIADIFPQHPNPSPLPTLVIGDAFARWGGVGPLGGRKVEVMPENTKGRLAMAYEHVHVFPCEYHPNKPSRTVVDGQSKPA